MKSVSTIAKSACFLICALTIIPTSASAEDYTAAANDELLKCFDACENFFNECVVAGGDLMACLSDKVACKRKCIYGPDKEEKEDEEKLAIEK